jgi:predicted ferric reductase
VSAGGGLHSHLAWMISRACGIGALVAFSAVFMLGLLAASGVLRRVGSKQTPAVTAFHRVLAYVSWPLIAAHALVLLADPWLKPSPLQLAWPFSLHMKAAFWAGLGVVATACFMLTTLTPWLAKHATRVPWQQVHRVASLAAYCVLCGHVLGAGSDFGQGVARLAAIQLIALSGVFVVLRVVIPLLPAQRPRAAVRG